MLHYLKSTLDHCRIRYCLIVLKFCTEHGSITDMSLNCVWEGYHVLQPCPGNRSVPADIKPSPEPMLTNFYDAVVHPLGPISKMSASDTASLLLGRKSVPPLTLRPEWLVTYYRKLPNEICHSLIFEYWLCVVDDIASFSFMKKMILCIGTMFMLYKPFTNLDPFFQILKKTSILDPSFCPNKEFRIPFLEPINFWVSRS